MNDKIFCGKGKKSQYSIKLNICIDEIPQEHRFVANNGNTYVRLELKERKAPDEKGNTHYITVDTWKPDGQQQSGGYYAGYNAGKQSETPAPLNSYPTENSDDLPF